MKHFRSTNWRGILALAGSSYSSSLGYWSVALALVAASSTLLLGFAVNGVTLWMAALANLVATVVALAGVVLWDQIRARVWDTSLAPFWLVLLIGTALGFARAAVLYLLLVPASDIPRTGAMFVQLVTPATFQLAWLMPALGVVGALIEKWDAARTELIRQRTAQRVLGQREQGAAVPEQVAAVLVAAREQLRQCPDDQLAHTLEQLADRDVRELSHRLWDGSDADIPAFRIGSLLVLVVRHHRFPALVIGLVSVLPLIFVQAFWVGFADAWWRGLIQAGLMVLCYGIGARIPTRKTWSGALVFVATVVGTPVLVVAISVATFPGIAGYPLQGATWSFVGTTALTTLVCCAVVEGRALSREIRDGFAAVADTQVQQAVGERVQLVLQREAARIVHGRVQGSLRALSAHARAGANPADVRRQAQELLERAEQEVSFGVLESAGSAAQLLDELVARWRGVVAVVGQLDGELGSDAELRILDEVLDEAISNAHRHGGAEQVWVALVVGPRHIVCEVRDDGRSGEAGTAGLGAAFFDAVTGGQWSRSVGVGGSLLRLELPRTTSTV